MSGSSSRNRRNHLRAGDAGRNVRDAMCNLQHTVDAFNRRVAVGDPVIVRTDSGEVVTATTRSAAQVFANSSAVVWLDGVRGCYALDRVTPVKAPLLVHIAPKPDDCDHDFQGWRDFADGNGGEQVCAKCGMGAMARSIRTGV